MEFPVLPGSPQKPAGKRASGAVAMGFDGVFMRRYCHGVSALYLSRTCLVPVLYPHVDRDPHGGTRQVRDRYAMDTPSELASSMLGGSALRPSRTHPARLLQAVRFKALEL